MGSITGPPNLNPGETLLESGLKYIEPSTLIQLSEL